MSIPSCSADADRSDEGFDPVAEDPAEGHLNLTDRRGLLRGGVALGAGIGVGALGGSLPAAAVAGRRRRRQRGLLDQAGVGFYTDLSTALQISTFTIGRGGVTCGVGTLAVPANLVPGGSTGPFAMLMYATEIDNFIAERRSGYLRASGTMRSITSMAGQVLEDVEHPFAAIATEEDSDRGLHFGVHFLTDFWTPGSNPLAAPSEDFEGRARFGGPVLAGEVNAGRRRRR